MRLPRFLILNVRKTTCWTIDSASSPSRVSQPLTYTVMTESEVLA